MLRVAMAEGAGTCGLYLSAVQPGAVAVVAAAKPSKGKV